MRVAGYTRDVFFEGHGNPVVRGIQHPNVSEPTGYSIRSVQNPDFVALDTISPVPPSWP